jgi:hypothetical protein
VGYGGGNMDEIIRQLEEKNMSLFEIGKICRINASVIGHIFTKKNCRMSTLRIIVRRMKLKEPDFFRYKEILTKINVKKIGVNPNTVYRILKGEENYDPFASTIEKIWCNFYGIENEIFTFTVKENRIRRELERFTDLTISIETGISRQFITDFKLQRRKPTETEMLKYEELLKSDITEKDVEKIRNILKLIGDHVATGEIKPIDGGLKK